MTEREPIRVPPGREVLTRRPGETAAEVAARTHVEVLLHGDVFVSVPADRPVPPIEPCDRCDDPARCCVEHRKHAEPPYPHRACILR